MERLERVGHLLSSADASIGIARNVFREHRGVNITTVREHIKEARRKLKQAIEAIDGVD
jgi:hypothetical protein